MVANIWLRWCCSTGWLEFIFFTSDSWWALILLALTLTMRLVRVEMIDVMQSDYIKFATARGISYRPLYFRHALLNTRVAVITVTGLQFGGVIACSIMTECLSVA
jgi:peptide/nickel transport system permease protein